MPVVSNAFLIEQHTDSSCFIVYLVLLLSLFLLLELEYISPFHLIASLLPSQTKTNTNDYAALSVSRYRLKLACKLENDELPAGLYDSIP